MSRCPNCNYELVYLQHRRKYKCPKCSKLFSEKEIHLREHHKDLEKDREEARKRYIKETNQNARAKKVIPKLIRELQPKKQPSKEQIEKLNAGSKIREKQWRKENHVLQQIKNLRLTQKRIAVSWWKNEGESLYTAKIVNSLPRMLLS